MKRRVQKLYQPSTDRGLAGGRPPMRALWPMHGILQCAATRRPTMTAYLIADIKVKDPKWIPDYAAAVHDLVHKHGGKYLARSGNVKTLEGKPLDTTLIALMAFPSEAAARAFANDPAYAPFVSARQGGSDSRFQLID